MKMEISENENHKRSDNHSPEEKEAASFLRERFLFLIASLPAKPCKIGMHNKTEVSAHIRAFDLSFENVIVENLKPASLPTSIPRSILRSSDIMTIKYEDV